MSYFEQGRATEIFFSCRIIHHFSANLMTEKTLFKYDTNILTIKKEKFANKMPERNSHGDRKSEISPYPC